ncbi:hypothetical protein N9V47_07490 [Luminiphilus sp.]|jgi:3-deoxy-D-manno-octulosonate 8-phosphate phosphatase KdsC-like HAD superfamily phosphatase|nr:hypothetical protein [Luminiphilus sp.]MDB2313479.1 hypothetical protein [Luminiphilus sp.]
MKIRDLIADTDDVLAGGKGFYSGDREVLKQFGTHDIDGFKAISSRATRVA